MIDDKQRGPRPSLPADAAPSCTQQQQRAATAGGVTAAPGYWRSLKGRARGSQPASAEFAEGADALELSGLSRRRFMGLLGASSALAGVSLGGCLRKPQEPILPYNQRPETLIPGKPRYFATSALIGGGVLGLVVESQDGRPTKIEGNPRHPMSLGAASAWAQAEVLQLYDPQRSRKPLRQGKVASWDDFAGYGREHFGALRQRDGKGLALLLGHRPSPTVARLLGDLRRACPELQLYVHDWSYPRQALAGMALAGVPGHLPLPNYERAEVIVALDADVLYSEGDAVRAAGQLAQRRVPEGEAGMSRLYVAEPALTLTGAMADHRLRLRASRVGQLLGALCRALEPALPEEARALARGFAAAAAPEGATPWLKAVADELGQHRGRGLLLVGASQPAELHALALLLNSALGNLGQTLQLQAVDLLPQGEDLEALAAAIAAKKVETLVVLGGNPLYTAPADLELARLYAQVPAAIHLGHYVDQTAQASAWHLPQAHFLEAWGDWQASDGTVSIQQPLIAPLHDGLSEIELLARLAGEQPERGYELVQKTWKHRTTPSVPLQMLLEASRGDDPERVNAAFNRAWESWLHEGVVDDPRSPGAPDKERGSEDQPASAPVGALRPRWSQLLASPPRLVAASSSAETLELVYRPDSSVADGRYANNGWLQELPDPITKLTWDNALLLSPATAERFQLRSMDRVNLQHEGRQLEAAALIVPGIAEGVGILPLGYGQDLGEVSRKAGVNAYALRSSKSPYWASGVTLAKGKGRTLLALTQEHGEMHGRPLIREASLASYRNDPSFAKKAVEHPPLRSLWEEPHPRDGQQWAMSIDLSRCIGCGACVVACQAENNIPVVGKRRVLENREMHWLRVDRYFVGSPAEPQPRFQPVPCQQCENAPCEQVCPVAASAHSPEGLNDQAYNRCIGTRYCSNNCPYKVRRFNFFQYNGDVDPLLELQKNPDVTVRFRGVMEKCTYCVQRIQEAKIQAKRQGQSAVPAGAILPACAQTCPTQAIVFGDLNDPRDPLVARKQLPRDYALLGELNNKPRTTYLAKLVNPKPELA